MNTIPDITVFTKPWPKSSAEELGPKLASLGFQGIELPVREGFQVTPDSVESTLPQFADRLRENGLEIASVAGELDEATAIGCGKARVPIIRTMLKLDTALSYQDNVDAFRQRCEALYPVLKETGVSIGLQNHCDGFACSSLSIIHAIEPLDPDCVSAVLDLGHTGLEGEREDIAIDIAWPRLSMINLKNALRFEEGKDENGVTRWNRTWVPGKEGYTSWSASIEELGRRQYSSPICITAEYKDAERRALAGDDVIAPLVDDLRFLQSLIESSY